MKLRHASEVLTEISIVALTVIVAFGLERLFVDRSYLPDLLLLVTASHLLALMVRRAGFGMGVSALVSAAAMLVVGNVVLFPETSSSIIPWQTTLDLLRTDLDAAWDAFADQQAPVEPQRGFVVAVGATLWWSAALADWAAFRLRSSPEAVVPASILFVFTALLGTGDRPVLHAALFAGAVGAVMLSIRLARQSRDEVWIASGAGAGLSATMRAGALGLTLALGVGAAVGPALPDAGDQLLDPSDWDNGPSTRFVTSPLVSINANLVTQSEVEMFSVKVDDPNRDRHYWRQMALTSFDGDEWRRSSNFDQATGPVGSDLDASVLRRPVRQEITTQRLGGIYLPAAYEVSRVVDTTGGVDLEYEVETGALVIDRDSENAAEGGFTYVIESAVPIVDPSDLPADATAGLDPDFIAELTALPRTCADGETSNDGCWSPRLTELARAETAGAVTDYERVLALQAFFLDPANFTYDLDVSARHSLSSMEAFVFDVNRGYCEQFAATFAALVRSIGIPARVAVGFTWGDWDNSRQEFVVRGTHAHAWPEVYFAGVGWVVLDPTPGRAPAINTQLAGLASPQQFGFNDEAARGSNLATPTTLPAPTFEGDTDGGDFADIEGVERPSDDTAPATTAGDNGTDLGAILPFFAIGAAVLALVGVVPALRWLLRRRRLAQVADDPAARTELAWDDATLALHLIGIDIGAAETPAEFATRAKHGAVPVGPIEELAESVTIVRYADLDDAIKPAVTAQKAAARVDEVCRNQLTVTRRWADALDPRTLSRR